MLEPEIHRPELDGLQEHGLHKVEEQRQRDGDDAAGEDGRDIGPFPLAGNEANTLHPPDPPIAGGFVGGGGADGSSERSEEHTSELQSLAYLVCRLLLGKKKKKIYKNECAN